MNCARLVEEMPSSKLQIDFEHNIQNEMYNIIETHTSQHHGNYEKDIAGLTSNCNGNGFVPRCSEMAS